MIMTKRSFYKPIVFIFCLFSTLFSFSQEEIDFQINLEEGHCFQVQTNMNSEITIQMGERKRENKNAALTIMQYQVAKKLTNSYLFDFKFVDFESKMSGMREITISPKLADDLNILNSSTQVSLMIDRVASAEISPKGKVIKIKNNENISKDLLKKSKKLTPAMREQVQTFADGFCSTKTLTSVMDSWLDYIPDTPVKIGDHWNVEKDSLFTRYTLVSETDTCYVIEGVGRNKVVIDNELQKGFPVTITTEETFALYLKIDKHTFLPQSITKKTEAVIKSELQNQPGFSTPPSRSRSTFTTILTPCPNE